MHKLYYKWTEETINFLKNNYPKYGAKKCSEILKIDERRIRDKAHKLQIKISKQREFEYHSETGKIKYTTIPKDVKNFIQVKSKEDAYILGFAWADGSINKKSYRLNIEIAEEDAGKIKHIFNKSSLIWKFSTRVRKEPNKQHITSIRYANKYLFKFLEDNGYSKKFGNYDAILSKIPKKLHYFWYRGLIDGDGCFFHNEKNRISQFVLSSGLDQDWSSFIKMLNAININYFKIKKRCVFKDSGSKIIICRKGDIEKLSNCIYPNGFDKIGLKRKYDKMVIIIESIKKRNRLK